MRIVFVAPFGMGQKTTVWARTLPLAKILASQSHNVMLLIPPWDCPEDSGVITFDEGVTIKQVKLKGGLPLITLRLISKILAFKPDIVHIVKPRAYAGIVQWLLWNARSFSGRPRVRLLLDIDDWEQSWDQISGRSAVVRRFLAWQEEWGIRHADGISAASLWLHDKVEACASRIPVLYLPNGVTMLPPTRAQNQQSVMEDAAEQSSAIEVLYLTRYVEVEAEWLADFWTALLGDWPGGASCQLVIAGGALHNGGLDDFRRRFLSRFNSSTSDRDDSVRWLGPVTSKDILRLYNTAACAIFPSATTPLQQAKCSVRLATTLLHGVPVIASAVGQQSEYGGCGAARLVEATATPAEFAEAVRQTLCEPDHRISMIEHARRHLGEHFQWRDLGGKLDSMYRSLLRERSADNE